jgi:hypothetical protein
MRITVITYLVYVANVSKLRGARETLKRMGLNTLIRETLRRIVGIPYTYRGIEVRDSRTFRLLKYLNNFDDIWGDGNRVFFKSNLGVLAVRLRIWISCG